MMYLIGLSTGTIHLLDELIRNPVTLALATLAIIFATIQFFDSLHLKRKMRRVIAQEDQLVGKTEVVTKKIEDVISRIDSVTKSIETVWRSLSTCFAGTFPKNVKRINEVVVRADCFFCVLTDWVSYGEYSAPQEFEEYKRHLRDLRIGRQDAPVEVRILAYDTNCLKQQLSDQFPSAKFDNIKSSDKFREYFVRYHPNIPVPNTYDAFVDATLQIEETQRRELRDWGVQIQELKGRSLILMWLEDGEDAVFCFQPHGGDEHGLSFVTRDIGLISSLYDWFRVHWNGDLPSLPHELPKVPHELTKAGAEKPRAA
jgi:hypothetical protein